VLYILFKYYVKRYTHTHTHTHTRARARARASSVFQNLLTVLKMYSACNMN